MTKSPRTNTKFDVHQEVTNRIVDAIETAGEFTLPWIKSQGGSFARPVNIASKNPYNGVNIVSLWVSAQANAFPSNVWAHTASGNRKGAKFAKVKNHRLSSSTRPSTPKRKMSKQVSWKMVSAYSHGQAGFLMPPRWKVSRS